MRYRIFLDAVRLRQYRKKTAVVVGVLLFSCLDTCDTCDIFIVKNIAYSTKNVVAIFFGIMNKHAIPAIGPEANYCSTKISKDSVAKLLDLM